MVVSVDRIMSSGLTWCSAYQNPGFDIAESQLATMQEGLLVAVDPIVFADIFFQAPGGELLLLLCEPGSGSGEIRQDKEGDEGNYDRHGTFNDEQPAPGTQAHRVVHVVRDTGSNQTGEST